MLLIRGGKIKPIVGEEMENGELLIGDDGKLRRSAKRWTRRKAWKCWTLPAVW